MGVLYLLALLVSITGMVVLDRRFGLFFWADARRAAIVLPVGVAFFLLWDLVGIGLGVFFRGETSYMTGLQLAPELPIEEVFFLTLLCYLTMDVHGFLATRSSRRSGARREARR
ncbi:MULTISPECIES: lycopene cyclase domain-containing protein [unclassified Rathayibacter]|uniref:lycopene cyclase domain-containing protein n=1 Tax=unclassified Rathayibacter TaxID=2609250 RepID=UPI00188ABF08|nr:MULTISPECIES: lycopene cyclase domain-containing protein [unclassified Rathayibacter]MBF4461408.1 lycopene cyclase domain-containing protein [Rathayibacter sp. VKM Ac-2879]MBF4502819.1 lycopene cyclase domain-containing protein [Rathayibacter sp. VKM Ac-2878]